MSDGPGNAEFGVDDQALQEFADSFAGAFPAALLAPVWQAMLKAGVVVAPIRVAVDQAEVVLIDPNTLELRVPVSTVSGQLVKSETRIGAPTTPAVSIAGHTGASSAAGNAPVNESANACTASSSTVNSELAGSSLMG